MCVSVCVCMCECTQQKIMSIAPKTIPFYSILLAVYAFISFSYEITLRIELSISHPHNIFQLAVYPHIRTLTHTHTPISTLHKHSPLTSNKYFYLDFLIGSRISPFSRENSFCCRKHVRSLKPPWIRLAFLSIVILFSFGQSLASGVIIQCGLIYVTVGCRSRWVISIFILNAKKENRIFI